MNRVNLSSQLQQQRLQHIIDSYRLDDGAVVTFRRKLDRLLARYPSPLIELALVETLVQQWASPPLVRGLPFLTQVEDRLQTWAVQPAIRTFTPEQFHQITGLTLAPELTMNLHHS